MATETPTTFSDVPMSNVHRDSVGALQAAGIAVGDGGGAYHPARPVQRDQAASLVARSLATTIP